jgi:hypothetical protein
LAMHGHSARSQLAASLSAPAARLSRRPPPRPSMHARSAGSQLAVPPCVLAAHARLVALHAGHACSAHHEARAVLYVGSVLATAPCLPMERRTSWESAAARANGAERRKISVMEATSH